MSNTEKLIEKPDMQLTDARNQWIAEQTKEIENCMNRHNTRRAFEITKELTMPDLKVKHAAAIEDKEGNLLTREEDVAKDGDNTAQNSTTTIQ